MLFGYVTTCKISEWPVFFSFSGELFLLAVSSICKPTCVSPLQKMLQWKADSVDQLLGKLLSCLILEIKQEH